MLISIPPCDGQVYIVGHTPPGVDDHESGAAALNERHNTKYLQLVRFYSDIIRGQFFGHWHSDTFRVIYSDTGTSNERGRGGERGRKQYVRFSYTMHA